MTAAKVTRDVAGSEPHNCLHRDVAAGEVFYVFTGCTYGAVDTRGGIALSEDGENPFFEFPLDAIEIEVLP